jgi:hypothetical protein
MRRVLQARRAPATVLGIMALVVAAAGGAYAATGSHGTITVCVHHKGGALYRAHRCARHDRKLRWNTKGPAGPTGAQGPAGAAGITTAWTGEIYPSNAVPQADGHVATFTFNSPTNGFVNLTAHFAVRVHNTPNVDCHVQNQIAATPSIPNFVPGTTVHGYIDNWINGNLPTENAGGTFLGLDASVSDVLPVASGSNTFYLNAHSDCAGAFWGPINFTALSVNKNPTATLTAP